MTPRISKRRKLATYGIMNLFLDVRNGFYLLTHRLHIVKECGELRCFKAFYKKTNFPEIRNIVESRIDEEKFALEDIGMIRDIIKIVMEYVGNPENSCVYIY